jgi:hypothetical protein
MVTKYQIPCSCCGKIVERYVFCSGACKVKGHREKKAGGQTDHVITESVRSGTLMEKSDVGAEPTTGPEFSDKPLPGYKFIPPLNVYVKQ